MVKARKNKKMLKNQITLFFHFVNQLNYIKILKFLITKFKYYISFYKIISRHLVDF